MTKTIGGYCITLNCVAMELPFIESIENALEFCDTVTIVDGESSDGTLEKLNNAFAKNDRVKVIVKKWDYSFPDMMGRQKTIARKNADGDYLWQFDVDEFLHPSQYGAIQKVIRNDPTSDLFTFPCITFHGGMLTLGTHENMFKWRLSKNSPNIIHGVQGQFRQYDENGDMFFDRRYSDSCEYIWEDTYLVVDSAIPFDNRLFYFNHMWRQGQLKNNRILRLKYAKLINNIIGDSSMPCVFHYSWVDYARKLRMEDFWLKQKRYRDGKKSPQVVGKWIKKLSGEITQQDIDATILKFMSEDILPVEVVSHPPHIVQYALDRGWRQADIFGVGK